MKKSVFVFFCLLFWSTASRAGEAVVVIVHPSAGAESLSREQVAAYFLKQKRSWPSGVAVRPVDWPEGQSTRAAFVESVLKRSEQNVAEYWIAQKLSSGIRPPLQLASEESICYFVSETEGGIGYLSVASFDSKRCPGVKSVGEFR